MRLTIEESITNVEVEETKKIELLLADFDVQHNAIEKSLIDAKGDLVVGTANDAVARLPVGANGLVLSADSAETVGVKWASAGGGDVACLVTLDGGGAAISTGDKLDIIVPFDLSIKEWYATDMQSGSIVLDLRKCTWAQFDNSAHPVAGDSVCASAKPTISTAMKANDTTLTGWTKSWSKTDVVRVHVVSCTNIQRLSFLMIFERS